jgi:hypothetical protein
MTLFLCDRSHRRDIIETTAARRLDPREHDAIQKDARHSSTISREYYLKESARAVATQASSLFHGKLRRLPPPPPMITTTTTTASAATSSSSSSRRVATATTTRTHERTSSSASSSASTSTTSTSSRQKRKRKKEKRKKKKKKKKKKKRRKKRKKEKEKRKRARVEDSEHSEEGAAVGARPATKKRRKRRPWSAEDTDFLRAHAVRFQRTPGGSYRWSDLLAHGHARGRFEGRRATDLKDKWANLARVKRRR